MEIFNNVLICLFLVVISSNYSSAQINNNLVLDGCTTGMSATGTSLNGAAPQALNGTCENIEVFRVAGLDLFSASKGSKDGPALESAFNAPDGLDIDGQGNIYVADRDNHTIRKITTEGVVSTLAGQAGVKGYKDGVGSEALFDEPRDISVDFMGNVYVVDFRNNVIRKITPSGVVSTYAGGKQGVKDGVGTDAEFNIPVGIDIDGQGNLYVAGLRTVRKIDTLQQVTTIANFPTEWRSYYLSDLVVAPSGIIYVANANGRTIHRVAVDGTTSLVAGQLGLVGEHEGVVIQDGVGSDATFAIPFGLEVDNCGNLYVADGFNLKLRKITPEGVVTTIRDFKGDGVAGFSDLIFDRAGNFLVADRGFHGIYRICLLYTSPSPRD